MAGTVTKVRDYRILLLRTSYNIIYDGKKVVAARRNEVWTLIFNLPALHELSPNYKVAICPNLSSQSF